MVRHVLLHAFKITFVVLLLLTHTFFDSTHLARLLFIRGVVDSDDLPLNVGREILQQSRSLRIIKQRLVKKSVEMMSELAATNATAYASFWKNFGKYVKVGIIEDEKSRPELVPLCRFYSSHSENVTSLPEYVSRMPAEQKLIYYVVGETKAQAAMAPALEKLKEKGYEVLYVSEPIDEMTLQNIEVFSEKVISDAGKEASSELTEEEKKEKEQKNEDLQELRTWMKKVLPTYSHSRSHISFPIPKNARHSYYPPTHFSSFFFQLF